MILFSQKILKNIEVFSRISRSRDPPLFLKHKYKHKLKIFIPNLIPAKMATKNVLTEMEIVKQKLNILPDDVLEQIKNILLNIHLLT